MCTAVHSIEELLTFDLPTSRALSCATAHTFNCGENRCCAECQRCCCQSLPGPEEALQSNPWGDVSLLLAPPTDQQLHVLHRRAGEANLPSGIYKYLSSSLSVKLFFYFLFYSFFFFFLPRCRTTRPSQLSMSATGRTGFPSVEVFWPNPSSMVSSIICMSDAL